MYPNFVSRTLAALALILCFGLIVFGQGTDLGTIRGTVTDATGAVVPNAQVTVTDLSTNTSRNVTTNGSGVYEVAGLRPGTFKVTVAAPGFASAVITGIELTGSSIASANAVLKLGAASEIVSVTAEAPVIHTEDQTISQTLTTEAVIDLPRDSRDVYSFLYLNPNITQGSADGEFKFIGAQSYGANFTLDGQRSNGGIFGSPTASQPSLEAVGEINILSNDFSAEYAGIANIRITSKRGTSTFHGSLFYNNKNSALAAWTLQDKIGQADFAPSAFQQKYPNPFFNINDVGASLGGPVKVPKLNDNTWFFMAYERNWTASPANVTSSTLPHPSLWNGDFSLLNDAAKPHVPSSITLTPAEIAQDTVGGLGAQFIQIPSRLLNPTVHKLITTYFPPIGLSAPLNRTTGRIPNFQTLLPTLSTRDLGTLRLDHDFSSRDHVYAVYNGSGANSSGGGGALVQAPFTGLGLRQTARQNHTLSASYTRIITPTLINEARGGFNRQQLLTHSNTTLNSFLTSIGFNDSDVAAYDSVVGNFAAATNGHPAISFSNTFATFANGGRNTYRPLDQNLMTFGDTLSWVKGKHNIRTGGDFVRNAAVDGFALNRGNPRGLMTYTGKGTDPFTNFLLGLPPTSVSFIAQPRPPMDVTNWESGYFIQDDWKITPRLTINMGLRYELITPFVDKNDLLANFDPNYVDPTTGQLGRFVLPSTKTLKYLDSRIINFGYVLADQSHLGIGRGLVQMDKTNFAPRFGAAWRVTDRTVLRGGYGLYYPTSAAQGIRDPIATNPFNQSLTKRSSATSPLQGWPTDTVHGISPISGGAIQGFGNTPAVNVVPFNLHQPKIQQWNVTLERDLSWNTSVRLSYLGSYLSGLIAGVDLNELRPSDTPFGTTTGDGTTICDPNNGDCNYSAADLARYRFPALGDYVLSYGNFGHGKSNALQVEVDRRYNAGLLFMFSYTYLDQKSTGLDTGNSSLGGITYNPFQPNNDYGEESFVSKHRVVAYGVWDVPFGRSRRYGSGISKLLDGIAGGWQTTFNMFAKSGTGFTPYWVCDNCGPAYPGNIGVGSVDAVGDFGNEPSFRPVLLNKNYAKQNGDQIWDPSAFGPPPVGADVFSNPNIATRNILRGPGSVGLNLGVHKDFHFTERVSMMLGADANNVLNHPLFSPDSGYGGGGGPFAMVGDFNISTDPNTGKILPITDVTPNPVFGRLINSFSQEGIDSRRTIRLRLRITF